MKKVAVYSNSSLTKSGFGKHARILLQWLNAHGYDAFEMAAARGEFDQNLKTLPWRAYGLTPETPEEVAKIQQLLQQNPGFQTALGYGNFGIEKVILAEKPDVIIAIEDSWAWPGLLGRSIFRQNPENWIFWCPQDSLPILESQKDFVRQVKHFAVKAPFAKKAFKEAGSEVKFWKALSDFEKFFPNREAGLALRRASGISDDTLCFGFVFRNQLRKLVCPLIEGFKIFNSANPKSKLVLHTHPRESWDIPQIMKNEGVAPDKVYFTKLCNKCKTASLGPAITQREVCKCGGEIVHPTVDHGITEEQLNAVYNSFDGYLHPANSGGAEFPVAEAIHAGIPTATVAYSYGEMYTDSGLVDSLPFTWYERHEDLFKKARATPEGIAAFMEKVKDLSAEEKAELSRKARDWAVEYFDIDKTCQEVANFIDTLPPADYNWSFPCAEPEMPTNENNTDWTAELHYKFFGDYPNESFMRNVMAALQNGTPREQIYQNTQNFVKNQLTPFNPQSLFKEDGKKRLLVGMEHNATDCVVMLSVLDQLKEKYKDWSIYLMTAPQNFGIFEHLEYLSGILPAHEMLNTNYYEESLVDIYLQPFKATQAQWNFTHNGYTL